MKALGPDKTGAALEPALCGLSILMQHRDAHPAATERRTAPGTGDCPWELAPMLPRCSREGTVCGTVWERTVQVL